MIEWVKSLDDKNRCIYPIKLQYSGSSQVKCELQQEYGASYVCKVAIPDIKYRVQLFQNWCKMKRKSPAVIGAQPGPGEGSTQPGVLMVL